MTASRRPTESAARKMAAALRRSDRLDPIGEAVAALSLVTARQVDEATAADVKEYAVAKVTTAHLGVLMSLARLVGSGEEAGDPFAMFVQHISTPSSGFD